MKLYIVKCVCFASQYITGELNVYVVAIDKKQAEEFALGKMRELGYKYKIAKSVELIADTDEYGCDHILVLDGE